MSAAIATCNRCYRYICPGGVLCSSCEELARLEAFANLGNDYREDM